jgi:hypothetical protein
MEDDFEFPRLDKTKLKVIQGFDDTDIIEYWKSKTPLERWEHVELLRRINYGKAATERMRKVLTIIKPGYYNR